MHKKTADFCDVMKQAIEDKSFVRLTLGGYQGQDTALKKILMRLVEIKGKPKSSFTYRYKTRDIVKNHDLAEGIGIIAGLLGKDFRSGQLLTTRFDLSYETMKKTPASVSVPPPMTHDQAKNRMLKSEGKAWMHALALTDSQGRILKSAQDKFRQIDRYVELLSPLLQTFSHPSPVISDMGSGKGYLTFALYDYLSSRGMTPIITGIDHRKDMVDFCNRIAHESRFQNLTFETGSIAESSATRLDVLIALHACDTATDDAIAKGIKANASIIVVAPCCHKQIRRDMDSHRADTRLAPILERGIFLERQAEMATDAIRTLILEYAGYKTKTFEFISDAHTPKNVMITAVKDGNAPVTGKLDEIQAFKALLGIRMHYLEKAMALDERNAL